MDLITILFSIVVILFLSKLFNNQQQRNYKNFPPGPKPLPIIGNILTLDISRPHKTLMELSKTYGPIFSVHMGMTKIVVLCGYEAVKDALINHADVFSDRPQIPVVMKAKRNKGVIFSNGENWKVMRRFTLSTLRDYGMGKKTIENKIIEEAKCLVQKLKSFEGPIDNLASITAAVVNIIMAIMMNHRFEYEDSTIQKVIDLVNENVRLFGSPWITLYNCFPSLMDWLPGPHRTMFENYIKLKKFMNAIFTKQKKELDVNDRRNLIDAFLAKQQEENPDSTEYFNNENLAVLVGNLFIAGTESTSATLRWGLLIMMKYPEIQQKVHDEIDRVIGSAQPQMEHRKLMPYTDAVIHEIQRFGDIVPSIPHATSEDVTFRGYFIPKGTVVLPMLHSILRDKSYFVKPYEFYPEHFLDSEGNFKKSEAFVPFSIGKRSCAGETLAKTELFLFFTTLLQHFTFQPVPGAKLDLTPVTWFTNSPKPFEICAISRM